MASVQAVARQNAQAAIWVVCSCAFFAGANGFAKALGLESVDGPEIHPLQIAFSRFLFGFLTITTIWFAKGRQTPLRPVAPLKLHIGRVTMGLCGLICVFWSLTALPLADVTAIAFSSPIFTMLFAVLFLSEVVGFRRPIAALVGFAGVLVMVQPTSESFQAIALVAFAAAVFTGAEVTFVRALAQRDHPITILLINNAIGTLLAIVLAFPVLRWPSLEQWPYLMMVGVTMVIGQLIFVHAMARGEANFLAPFYYANLIFAAIYGYLIFGESLQWTNYIGAGLIIASGLYISLRTRN